MNDRRRMELAKAAPNSRLQLGWPANIAEAEALAAKIREIAEVPFAAMELAATGIGFVHSSAGQAPEAEWVGEAQSRIRSVAATLPASDIIKHFYIGGGGASKIPFDHVAIVRVGGEIRVDPSRGGRTTRGRAGAPGTEERTYREFGYLVFGSPKALTGKSEALALCLASWLGSLGVAAELDSMIVMRDQFLSIASHELKTPLTSIYGLLQLQERMLNRAQPPSPGPDGNEERQRSFLKTMIRQVKRLNELIDGLLDVSRIQNGRFIVEPTDTEVSTLLREVVDGRLNIRAQEADVRIQIDAPENLTAWIDPIRFEEVITNLVMNAIRFSPEGGVVWVKLERDGEALRLSVRDQGESVPEGDRERIFQPFERAKRSGRLGGLGLGLFISRQIARLHGGDVALIESSAGRGNAFEATFPLRDASRASA